jgi:hypothetical protein
LRRYVRAALFWEYPGLDVTGLPQHVALLPFVWAVAPIAWATDLTAEVDELDATVSASLAAVRSELHLAYPGLGWKGDIRARREAQPWDAVRSEKAEAALFSGGLDSTYTALRHRGPQLLLVAAWGPDIALGDTQRWGEHVARLEQFARREAGGLQVVRTNVRSAMDYRRLNGLSAEIARWWVDVQFGTTLTGLAAPVAAAHGIGSIYLASGAKWEADKVLRNGSAPRIDNAIDFGFARVHHDGNDVSRQQKVNFLVASGRAAPLRVCVRLADTSELNCGRCIKCVRTIAGLVVAGGDPRQYGFDRYTPAALAELPRRFEAGEFEFGWFDIETWADIRDHRPADVAIDPAFEQWLTSFDFTQYARTRARGATRSRAWVRRVRGAAPWLEPVVAPLRGVRGIRRWLP